MKWEELSLKDRAELMRIYLDNGISSIASIKKHYNSFADGGEVDNAHSTPAQDFVASWLSNRQEQFQENFRNSGSTMIPYSVLPKSWSNKAAFNEFQNQLKNLRTVKQYDVLGNTKFPHIPNSEFEFIKKLSNHTGGAYNPATHSISYISPYAGTDVHELTHSLNANPQLNTIRYGFKGDKLQEGKQYNSYKDSADEIYSRLMQFRYLNKLDPKKKYTIEDIKKWRERYNDTDIINRYNDEYLLHLLNNVASTKSGIEKDGKKLAAYGGPLKDEYDNPDQYYDYITAEEAGDMYDPKTKHWSSRDPRTGMILKNPKHPTFNMAIREDQSSGYTPFIDFSTGRYYTLTPEEYAMAPNKMTLKKANLFQTGGLKDRISYQTPETQRKEAAKNDNYWGSLPIEDKAKLLQYYGKMGVTELEEAVDYYNSSPEKIREYILKAKDTIKDDLIMAPHYKELYDLKNRVDTTALKYSMRAFRLAGIPDKVNAAYHGNTVEESGGNFYQEQANGGPGYGRDQRERWTTKEVVKNGKKVKVRQPNERWVTYIDNTPDNYVNDDRETLWSINAFKEYVPGGKYKQEWSKGSSSYKDTRAAQKAATSGNLPIDKNTILLRQIFFRPANGKSDSTRVAAGKLLNSVLSENQRDTVKITMMP